VNLMRKTLAIGFLASVLLLAPIGSATAPILRQLTDGLILDPNFGPNSCVADASNQGRCYFECNGAGHESGYVITVRVWGPEGELIGGRADCGVSEAVAICVGQGDGVCQASVIPTTADSLGGCTLNVDTHGQVRQLFHGVRAECTYAPSLGGA
jgi:hypothetical protein